MRLPGVVEKLHARDPLSPSRGPGGPDGHLRARQVLSARQGAPASYYDHSGYPDALADGVRMIPVTTPDGTFRVWTRRVGNNPRVEVLLLTGGPGLSHAYQEALDSHFPGAGIQYYYYDQRAQRVRRSRSSRIASASARFVPHMSGSGRRLRHTAGRRGSPNSAQR